MTAPESGTLLAKYAMESDDGARYPWIQFSEYEPKNSKAKIDVVVPEDALEMLSETAASKLETTPIEMYFDEEEVLSYRFDNVRWVILQKPESYYCQNKETKEIIRVYRGLKFGKTWKSVAKLYLAAVVDGEMLLNDEGELQIFQMKLTGLKTQWVGSDDVERNIYKFNSALCKHYGLNKRTWAASLASVRFAASPRLFKSKEDDQDSWGAMPHFEEGDSARPLSEANQKLTWEWLQTEEAQALGDDPFGLKGKSTSNDEEVDLFEDSKAVETPFDEDIAF